MMSSGTDSDPGLRDACCVLGVTREASDLRPQGAHKALLTEFEERPRFKG